MALCNIVDNRKHRYNINCDVVFEPSCKDNCCKNATYIKKTEDDDNWSIYQLSNITVQKAIEWAIKRPGNVTVYLYDKGSNQVGWIYDNDGNEKMVRIPDDLFSNKLY